MAFGKELKEYVEGVERWMRETSTSLASIQETLGRIEKSVILVPDPDPTPIPHPDPTPVPKPDQDWLEVVDVKVNDMGGNVALTYYSKPDLPQKIEPFKFVNYLPVWAVGASKKNEDPWHWHRWQMIKLRENARVDKIKDGNKIYYIGPLHSVKAGFGYDLDTMPDMQLPRGKILVNQCLFETERGTDVLARKGNTYLAHDSSVPNEKRVVFISDHWLESLGMPKMYASKVIWEGKVMERQKAFDLWCKAINEDVLLNKFINTFGPYKGYGLIHWNAEDNIGVWTVDRWKIENCFKWAAETMHDTKIAAWGQCPYNVQRIIWEHNGKTIDWDRLPYEDWPEGGLQYWPNDFFRYVKVWEVGDYLGRFDNCYYIHHLLTHYFANKIVAKKNGLSPKIIGTFFADMESNVDDYMEPNSVERTTSDGTVYYTSVKAPLLPYICYNTAVWMLAVADGVNIWDYPYFYFNGENDDYGEGWSPAEGSYFMRLKDLTIDQKRDRKNLNYFYWGVWCVSENKDIIEANGEWVFPLMPDACRVEGKPLVAYKIFEDEALVLAMQHVNAGNAINDIPIKVKDRELFVRANGQWTTVVRIKL